MHIVIHGVLRYPSFMRAPVTLRLDKATRLRIARIARRRRMTASELIREAIESWADQQEAVVSPYEVVADLVGVARGGNPQRSADMGRQLTRLLGARRKRA
jgi:predicted transcriptional regulator